MTSNRLRENDMQVRLHCPPYSRGYCGGGIRNIPIELAEKEYCVVVEQVAVRQDSEGAGKFRGAVAIKELCGSKKMWLCRVSRIGRNLRRLDSLTGRVDGDRHPQSRHTRRKGYWLIF